MELCGIRDDGALSLPDSTAFHPGYLLLAELGL